MNKSKQLAQLILSFYREDSQSLQQLKLLTTCQLFRRWHIFYIRCSNQETGNAIAAVYPMLREPISQLRLAKKIVIMIEKTQLASFPVQASKAKNQEYPASRQEKTEPPLI